MMNGFVMRTEMIFWHMELLSVKIDVEWLLRIFLNIPDYN